MYERLSEIAEGGRLPNFILVGAARAGTTSVYELLRAHPEVYCSPIKEPNFFCDDINPEEIYRHFEVPRDAEDYVKGSMDRPWHNAYVRNPRTYVQLFRNVEQQKAIGEFSVSYLFSSNAAENIQAALPNTRILMVLRNPVDRAISHYQMDCMRGVADASFRELIERDLKDAHRKWGRHYLYIDLGLYSKQVARFFNEFPREQIKIILFDDLWANHYVTMRELYGFLGVDTDFSPSSMIQSNESRPVRFPLLNTWMRRARVHHLIRTYAPRSIIDYGKDLFYSKDKKKPAVSQADIKFLGDFFRDDIISLSSLLDRDLSHWISSEQPKARNA